MARDRHDQPLPDEGDPVFPPDDLPLFFDTDADDDVPDCFAPPADACECYCLHCGRLFMSDQMWFQRVVNADDGFTGFWMCPTPNCDGRGFTFDIFPTDPDHPANSDVSNEDGFVEEEPGAWDEEIDAEYDPAEPQYAELDDCCPEDVEGEEWKYGLEPGETPPLPDWCREARQEWEERQRRFEEPDERPREIDMREIRRTDDGPSFDDGDIPC